MKAVNPSLKRFHRFYRRFGAIPPPEKVSTLVRPRTSEAYDELRIAWTRFKAMLGADCLDSVEGVLNQRRKRVRVTNTLRTLVKRMCTAKRLTQEEIGEKLGISQARVWQINSGYYSKRRKA